MGLIKAAMGAAGGVMADQWKEFFYCDSMDKDVMVIGASNHCEIWSKQRWDEICAELDTTSIVDIMDEIGF